MNKECVGCKYENNYAGDDPCVMCSVLTNHFEPKKYDEIDMVNHPLHYQHGIEPIDTLNHTTLISI